MFATEQLHTSELFYTKGRRVNLFRKTSGKVKLSIYENERDASRLNHIFQTGKYSKKLRNGNIICVFTTNRLARQYFKVEITGFGVKGMKIVEFPFITILG